MRKSKREIERKVAERLGYRVEDTRKIVSGLIEEIEKEVGEGNEVVFIGFGIFKKIKRAGKRGYNPNTGEVEEREEKESPVFRPGLKFKRRVEGDIKKK